MVDIQAAAASSQVVGKSGQFASSESISADRKTAEDSEIERKEAEPSATLPGVGDNVDIQA